MSTTEEFKLSPFDYIFWKLSICGWNQSNYNVVDFLCKYTDRDPEIRCYHLLERTGMLGSVPEDKIRRPYKTYTAIVSAHYQFRNAGKSA